MKLIIAGSRSFNDYDTVVNAFQEWPYDECKTIVSGTAKGADKLGERIAKEWQLNLVCFYPNWDRYKKQAGILRNIEMGNYADALLAFWDGQSPGTKQMIEYMKSLNKPVVVV